MDASKFKPQKLADCADLLRSVLPSKLSVKAFTSGGGSSNAALVSLESMIASFKLEKVTEGVISKGEPSEEDLEACKKLGEALTDRALKRAEPPKD